MASAFISYSHVDEDLKQQLEKHLAPLKREGALDIWHDRRLVAGDHIDHGISEKLEQAEVILLLVSPDFLASPYCFDVEVKRAMERHDAGEARVIPIILRHCDWKGVPFGRLSALPQDGKPVTKWPDRDEAFLEIVTGIRGAIAARPGAKPRSAAAAPPAPPPAAKPHTTAPRSSNLRMRKEFTEADEDRFLQESFEFIALYFENSLSEMEKRNPGISTTFRRVSAEDFTAVVYRDGKAKARCRIRFAGRGGLGGITFSHSDAPSTSSYNESLSVEKGPHELFLKALGMSSFGAGKTEHLSQEGAAEYLWGLFIDPAQR
jgi:hypothetical protein